jgi:putative ABC transport system substrate-binding protein
MLTRRTFAIVSAAALAGAARPGFVGTAAAQRRPFRVALILWRGETDVERGMQDYLHRSGVPIDFSVRDLNQDKSKLAGAVADMRAAKPDLVYVFGTDATLGIVGPVGGDRQHYVTDIPVVFAAVGDPVSANIVTSLDHSGRNLTGVIHLPPAQVQFQALEDFFQPKRIGVLYNSGETYGAALVKQLAEMTRKAGIETFVETCANAAGVPDEGRIGPALERINARHVDVLYLPSTSFFIPLAASITKNAIDLGLPAFSPNESMIRDGQALAGLVASQYEVGQFAGFKIEQILARNVPAADIPIEPLSRFSLVINMAAAKKLRVYPPITMLRYAEIVNG